MDGNSLRELRRASHLSQIQLAQKTGISRTRIQLAESGALQLSDDELQAIRAAVRPGVANAVMLLCSEFDCGEGSKEPKDRAERKGEDA